MVPTIRPPAVTRPTTTVSSAGPAGLNPQTNWLAAGSNRSRFRARVQRAVPNTISAAAAWSAALRATSPHTWVSRLRYGAINSPPGYGLRVRDIQPEAWVWEHVT